VLVPADGGALIRHKPGQYLGFSRDVPGVGTLRRNYSISSAANDRSYRITVKREATPGVAPGAASNWLHDHALPGTVLRAAAPAGDFFLDPEPAAPKTLWLLALQSRFMRPNDPLYRDLLYDAAIDRAWPPCQGRRFTGYSAASGNSTASARSQTEMS
jgi:hypothetical protein